jgi:RecJ-like exonuclease
MRCEVCDGKGQVPVAPTPIRVAQGAVGVVRWIVCPECRGARIVSCCEGSERQFGADVPPLFSGREMRA